MVSDALRPFVPGSRQQRVARVNAGSQLGWQVSLKIKSEVLVCRSKSLDGIEQGDRF